MVDTIKLMPNVFRHVNWRSWLCRAALVFVCLPLMTFAQTPGELPPNLQTVTFFSSAVAREMKYDIILPADYHHSDQSYPVLYLLHGHMQNYTVWGRNLGAAFYAGQIGELIVVMPDGGNSWFVNFAENHEGQANNWEDHIIEDVLGHVDANFRTQSRREGRAIAGLSMGGYGAITLALRNPDKFVSAASTSGALGYARNRAQAISEGRTSPERLAQGSAEFARADAAIAEIIAIEGFSTQDERTPRDIDFATAEQAQAYDPFHIIYQLPKSRVPHIYLDSGTEDTLINVTREFMQILLINDIPFDFMQSRGRHSPEYWRHSVGHFMSIQNEVMQRALGNRP